MIHTAMRPEDQEKTQCELAIPIVSVVVLLVIYMEAGLVGMSMLADIFENEIAPQIEEAVTFLDEAMGDEDIAALLAALQEVEPSSSAASSG